MEAAGSGSAQIKLTSLPDTVLLQIFRYLDINSLLSVASSCKLLKSVAYIPILWQNKSYDLFSESEFSDATSKSLAERKVNTLKIIWSDSDLYIFSPICDQGKKNLRKMKAIMNSEWTGNVVKTLIISSHPDYHRSPFNSKVQPLFGVFTGLRCLVLTYTVPYTQDCAKIGYSEVNQRWVPALSTLVNLEQLVY